MMLDLPGSKSILVIHQNIFIRMKNLESRRNYADQMNNMKCTLIGGDLYVTRF